MTAATRRHARDRARAGEAFRVAADIRLADRLSWWVEWDIEKWSQEATLEATRLLGGIAPTAEDFHRLGIKPYEVAHLEKNLLTTAGIGRVVSLLTGGGGTTVGTTTARVGVGNGAGTAAIGDTDLSAAAGSSNRWFQTCTVTTPSNVLTFAATFGTADGNFAWNEFGIDVSVATVTSGNTVGTLLLNHKTSIAQGTKASGQTWSATATITIS